MTVAMGRGMLIFVTLNMFVTDFRSEATEAKAVPKGGASPVSGFALKE